MKFSIMRVLVAMIYLSFMFLNFYKSENFDNSIMIEFLIQSLVLFTLIFNPEFVLPKQFTPLNQLNTFGKVWRIFFAGMAVFWGCLLTFGVLTKIVTNEVSTGDLLAGSIFMLIGYAGFMMLRTK